MRKVRDSVSFAISGIRYVLKSQRNMKIMLLIMLIVVIFGFILNISNYEWLIIVLISTFVITLEIINTALEETVNLVTEEYKKTAKHAKDTAAGAVLTASIGAIIIGIIIFLPKII